MRNVLVAVTPWTPCHHSVDLSWKRTIFQYIYICCYHRSRYEVYHPQSAHQHPVLVQVLRTRRQRTFGPCRQVSLVPMESCWMVRGPSSKYLAIYFELISLDLTIKMSHATTNQNRKYPNNAHMCTNRIFRMRTTTMIMTMTMMLMLMNVILVTLPITIAAQQTATTGSNTEVYGSQGQSVAFRTCPVLSRLFKWAFAFTRRIRLFFVSDTISLYLNF